MVKAIFPLFYFPPIPYFAYWLIYKNRLIEINENFVKQSFRNRTVIKNANGKLKLIIPLKHKKNHKSKYYEMIISYEENWVNTHWRSIETAYRSSPYFEYYEEIIFSLYKKAKKKYFKKLMDFNLETLKISLDLLNFDKKFELTKYYIPKKKNYKDLRNYFTKNLNFNDFKIYYNQLYENKLPFIKNLSILDLIFNEGPFSKEIIFESVEKLKNNL